MAKVNFIASTLAKYNGLETKDANTLYFIEDAKKIFKGTVEMTESLQVVTTFPAASAAVEGKLYLNATTFEAQYKSGNAMVSLMPGYVTAKGQFTDANGSKLATISAIKGYITDAIADITGGTAFVKDVTFADGSLSVDKGDTAPVSVPLTGMAKAPTYDSASLKLTIPVVGGDSVVVDIPKDKFVKSGKYYKDYPETNPTQHNVIVLEVEQGDPVVIPATGLVDVYTADNTGKNVTVTISDDNKVSAEITVDPVAGNKLTYSDAGFKVDISGDLEKKMNTYSAGNASELVLSDATGMSVTRSGVTILSGDATLGTSDTAVATAKVIAAAIASAVTAAQEALQANIDGKIDKMTGTVKNKILLGTDDGGVQASDCFLEKNTLTGNATYVPTSKVVMDAISWGTIA